jgi:hypothetical protein
MTDEGFGLADLKCEGDTIFAGQYDSCHIVRNYFFTSGMYFVIGEDDQPIIVVKNGVEYFVLHSDKQYAVSHFRGSSFSKFIKYVKRLINE